MFLRPFRYISYLFILLIAAWIFARWQWQVSWWWAIALIVVYIHSLVFGAIFIGWNFYLKSYNKGKQKEIALTFDDGPAQHTSAILDILRELNVQAAFFSIGKNAEKHPDILKRWHEEGHIIGNHSYEHGFHFDWKSAKGMVQELEHTNGIIQKHTGLKPKLFRPPYGVTNPNLAAAVRYTGMHSIGWSARSFDTTAKDPEKLLDNILSNLKEGDIILLHDSMAITRDILTELIGRAREKGFTFARVDKLLEIDGYA